MERVTAEEAVVRLRQQPDKAECVRSCYFDDPLLEAAKRFSRSEEWGAVRRLLPCGCNEVLDLGAGRGIASYAFARDGCRVTAVEPDTSDLVGAGSIRALARKTGLPIRIVEDYGESLSFEGASFDIVYSREVLHHVSDMKKVCCEVARVLRPAGLFIATREHVISRPEDMTEFLERHELHFLHGQERAFFVGDYISAITGGGMALKQVLGSFDTVINYYPMTREAWRRKCGEPLFKIMGYQAALLLTRERHWIGRKLLARLSRMASRRDAAAGRMYTFIGAKI